MNNRTLSLVPKTVEDLKEAIKVRAARFNAHNNYIRPVIWLKKNGLCMDNIKERSTIKQAGRGAFATRMISKGSFVAPIPLHHICDIVDKDHDFFSHFRNGQKQKTGQLLLNYCFGHPSSTHLTLCPYGSLVSLINHNSKEVNVKIRWSTSKLHQKDWLNMPLPELCAINHNGLMFDIVATKDILPNEEIFLNYGNEWSNAWDAHVQNWRLTGNHSKDYKSASALNKGVIRSMKEQESNPYPDNVQLECCNNNENNTQNTNHQNDTNNEYNKCKIISREEGSYSVEIIDDKKVILHNVPRKNIIFKDLMYTSDMFLNNVFRHRIMIPADLFPSKWRDSYYA